MTATAPDGIERGAGGVARCFWAGTTEEYGRYHDDEWGFPVSDDVHLFEKLCLEGFQAGLSWLTILRKREAFRAAFAGFDFDVVARFGETDVQRLLGDAGIVRHRGKIEAAINNAQRARELIDAEGSLSRYVWSFAPASRDAAIELTQLRQLTTSDEATALAKDLKKRGWRFVGPTTVYAFMQSMGLVNDHLAGCDTFARARAARAQFILP